MTIIKQQITHGLWFDNQAEEAARFYTSVFPDSSMGQIVRYGKDGFEFHGQAEGSVMTVSFELSGLGFSAVNGGPQFKINPSISFFVTCETLEETDMLWNNLSGGSTVLMPLDKYEWSKRYGWIQDRYGLSWQIAWGKLSDVGQKITPSLLFTNSRHGRAENAIHFYTSAFDNSDIMGILKYKSGESEPEGTVKHAMFSLLGQKFMAMDSAAAHGFAFNEAVTIIVNCRTQEEIDYYWNKLTEGGEEGPCGWLKDKFGVSWQVDPVQLSEMLCDPDKEKVRRVTEAFMRMKKFDIRELELAFNG